MHNVTQMTPKLAGKDDPGSNVVSITEAAWDAKDLIFIEQRWTLDKAKQMHAIRTTTAGIEGIRRFDITIRSRSTQNTNARRSHLPRVPSQKTTPPDKFVTTADSKF
jgi:hypothetical protein